MCKKLYCRERELLNQRDLQYNTKSKSVRKVQKEPNLFGIGKSPKNVKEIQSWSLPLLSFQSRSNLFIKISEIIGQERKYYHK